MTTTPWFAYEGTDLFRINGSTAYTYKTSHVSLDADGSPRAYHPQDTGLDYLANAGYPHKGWKSVLVVDPAHPDQPYIQPGGPHQGYFVAKTSLADPALPATDPRKYVDSETIPYIVFPGAFYAISGTGGYGDLVFARKLGTALESAAIVADGGPAKAPLGEMSLRLAIALGGHNPNPRNGHGAPGGTFQYLVFPRSRSAPPWRRSLTDIEASVAALLAAIGGWPAI